MRFGSAAAAVLAQVGLFELPHGRGAAVLVVSGDGWDCGVAARAVDLAVEALARPHHFVRVVARSVRRGHRAQRGLGGAAPGLVGAARGYFDAAPIERVTIVQPADRTARGT